MRILSMIGDDQLVKLYENFPECNKMIYLDTVISGRASYTILMGFREAGYTPYPILMIDRRGVKLNPKYSWISRQLEHRGLTRLGNFRSAFMTSRYAKFSLYRTFYDISSAIISPL